jgi:adenine-specific DNA-methyltransferase
MGDVEVIQGDCLEVMAGMEARSVDAVVTDPPYGVDYRGKWNSKWDTEWRRIKNDRELGWLPDWTVQLSRILVDDAFVVCFYSWQYAGLFLEAFCSAGFRPTSQLVFVKNQIGLGYHTRGAHEQAYLFVKGSPKPQIVDSDVISWTRVKFPFHPTQKPLDSLIPLVSRFCPPDGLVLDPFAGSGSTLVACMKTGRRGIGIEIDPKYCEIARQRVREAETPLFSFLTD